MEAESQAKPEDGAFTLLEKRVGELEKRGDVILILLERRVEELERAVAETKVLIERLRRICSTP